MTLHPAIIIAAGSLVGVLTILGLMVCVRVVRMTLALKRAMKRGPPSLEEQQRRINAAQSRIAQAQRELAQRKATAQPAKKAPRPRVRVIDQSENDE